MKKILTDLLALFFPRICAVCGTIMQENEEHLCRQCFDILPRFTGYAADKIHERLIIANYHHVRAAALFRYTQEGSVKKIIYPFKYYGNRKMAYYMGKQLAVSIPAAEEYKSADFLIPVPLHPRRSRKRGFNQAEELCKGLSSIWNIPIREDAVRRIVYTCTQTGKLKADRYRNVQNIFVLNNTCGLERKFLILVDDVLTTGATISTCAQCLFGIDGIKVGLLTLAATADK